MDGMALNNRQENSKNKYTKITKWALLVIAIILCIPPTTCSEDVNDTVIVNVTQGTLRGKQETGITGDKYYSFKGIPYANPPLGELRFRAPQPPDSWTGVRDATVHRGICFQYSNVVAEPAENESEDCLYLNVYSLENPNYSQNKAKPVMFWVHGGAFTSGSGNSEMFGPDYMILEDIILVTFNYRLNIFGFLRADDPDVRIPGNAGMKDMVMALQWTKDNIGNFGGDPNNITVFGLSAGGVSTHLLTLSPMTKGLFKRAIIESGVATAMWGLVLPETNQLLEMARTLNISYDSEKQVVEELYKLPSKDVIRALMRANYTLGDPLLFGPTVEKSSDETTFLSDHPLNIIRSGNYNKMPVIFGFVSREGMLLKRNGLGYLIRDLEDFIPFNWRVPKGSLKAKELAENISKFYYNGGKPTEENVDITFTLLSDTYFVSPMYQAMREQLKVSDEKMYLYRFSVDGKNNIMKKNFNITLPGVCHGENNLYRFTGRNVPAAVPNSLEDLTIKRFVKLCTNFAKYGDPNPREESDLINVKWDPVSDQFNYLELGENLSTGVNPEMIMQKFWDELYESIEN